MNKKIKHQLRMMRTLEFDQRVRLEQEGKYMCGYLRGAKYFGGTFYGHCALQDFKRCDHPMCISEEKHLRAIECPVYDRVVMGKVKTRQPFIDGWSDYK